MRDHILPKLIFALTVVSSVYPAWSSSSPPIMKHKVIVADEGNGKVHYINLSNPTEQWTITTDNRDLQLIGNDRLMVSVGDGYAEYNVKTGAFIKKITSGGTVQSVFRLTPKSTFIGSDGNPASGRSRGLRSKAHPESMYGKREHWKFSKS